MPARSLLTVRTNIRTDLNRGSAALTDARIDEAIQTVIANLRGRRLGFNVKRDGITLGSEYVTLPDDFLEIDSLKADFSSYTRPLIETTPAWIIDENRDPDFTSEPVRFAVQRDGSTRELRLYPPPDQTYSAEMRYLFDLAESASWTDSLELAWFDEAYLVVKYAAMAELEFAYIGDQDGQMKGGLYQAMAEKHLKALESEVGNEQSTGLIQPCI